MGKHMDLILRAEVDNLGDRGDIVKVKAGYGRNFLLPRKLAVPLTEGNKKVVEQQRLSHAKRDAKDKADAETLAAALGQVTLSFSRKAGEAGALFGSVTSIDVAEALAQKGYNIERRKIQLPDPIKVTGEYQVPVKLHKEVIVQLGVTVAAEEV
jgi:large subunit ribosomal protein L9